MLLGVNIDHIATLRNARGNSNSDNIIMAAQICQESGADSITVHLREDRRHILDNDVISLKKMLEIPLNLEMALTLEMIEFALRIKPDYCCIVPEKRQEITTEGGLDIISKKVEIKEKIARLNEVGIVVSIFIDPEISQIEAAKEVNVPFIELHTGRYANRFERDPNDLEELNNLISSAKFAQEIGLKVNAGHGLNFKNVVNMKKVPNLHELNIGHSIVSEAIFESLEKSVRKMKRLIS